MRAARGEPLTACWMTPSIAGPRSYAKLNSAKRTCDLCAGRPEKADCVCWCKPHTKTSGLQLLKGTQSSPKISRMYVIQFSVTSTTYGRVRVKGPQCTMPSHSAQPERGSFGRTQNASQITWCRRGEEPTWSPLPRADSNEGTSAPPLIQQKQ